MTDADRVASLATIAARLEMLRERLALYHVPVAHLVELTKIQEATESVVESFDPLKPGAVAAAKRLRPETHAIALALYDTMQGNADAETHTVVCVVFERDTEAITMTGNVAGDDARVIQAMVLASAICALGKAHLERQPDFHHEDFIREE